MNFPISRLIEHQSDLVTVGRDEPLRTALTKMVANDFSQLPVVNNDGHLTGVVSEQSISRSYFYSQETVSLFELPVHQCQAKAITISPEADVFEALGRLKDVAAVIVVKERKPVAVLTYYDATHFFQEVSENLMYVEDIEVTLRQYIEAIFDDDKMFNDALIRVFGEDQNNPGEPNKFYEQFSFYSHIQFITHQKNWSNFKRYFEPVDLFRQYMEQVRVIRNQLAHFRDDISTVQRHALLHTRDWLASRPKPPRAPSSEASLAVKTEAFKRAKAATAAKPIGGKYAPLHTWLREIPTSTKQVETTFEEIERVIGEDFPPSARTHRAWWANDTTNMTRVRAWLQAGWRVSDVDMQEETVVFERSHGVYYQVFFGDVLEDMRKLRPAMVSSVSAAPRNSQTFGSGFAGLRYGWSFGRNNTLRVEIYIDRGDKTANKAIFDALQQRKADIEQRFGQNLKWGRLDNSRASRIAIYTSGSITDSPEHLAELRRWAVETMLKFIDGLQPHLKEVAYE